MGYPSIMAGVGPAATQAARRAQNVAAAPGDFTPQSSSARPSQDQIVMRQQAMQRQAQRQQLTSNVQRTQHQTSRNIINNLR